MTSGSMASRARVRPVRHRRWACPVVTTTAKATARGISRRTSNAGTTAISIASCRCSPPISSTTSRCGSTPESATFSTRRCRRTPQSRKRWRPTGSRSACGTTSPCSPAAPTTTRTTSRRSTGTIFRSTAICATAIPMHRPTTSRTAMASTSAPRTRSSIGSRPRSRGSTSGCPMAIATTKPTAVRS